MVVRDNRNLGTLSFEFLELKETLNIYWELKDGELEKGRKWLVIVSFAPDYSVPKKAQEIIFKTLRENGKPEPSIKLLFFPYAGFNLPCVLYDVLELQDCGAITIANIGSNTSKLTTNRPFQS